MLGHRNPQIGLFDTQTLPHRVPADSFYGRTSTVYTALFDDDALSEMYDVQNGRPSLPPSLIDVRRSAAAIL